MADTNATVPGGDSARPGPAADTRSDNLQLINGIGRAVADRLRRAGIRTFRDLAARSPNELAAIVTGVPRMSVETIVRQDWLGQARKRVAVATAAATAAEGRPAEDDNGKHYQTFTVELHLDHGDVRRTRIWHVQTGDRRQWTGLLPDELLDF